MSETPPMTHVPRLYQEEAMAAAVNRNIICRMDTGTGKTLIAILLTRHITSQSPPSDAPKVHKLVVFIVPTVSLVDQTSAVLRNQTSLKVASFIGAMGVEYWKREEWIKKLVSADVVVMTAQIWLDILTNAYWDLERVSLIVFDEAHHCAKRHPYAQIMKDHYHPLKLRGGNLPRVLALTASPIFNAKDPLKSISELEASLDARIFEVSSRHAHSIEAAASKPTEKLVLVPIQELDDYQTPSEVLFYRSTNFEDLDRRIPSRLALVRKRIGVSGVTIFLAQLAKDLKLSSDLQEQLMALIPTTIELKTLSPHIRALIDVLAKYRNRPEFHGICFMEARHNTQILADLLPRVELLDWLRPAFLVGHGDQGRPENFASAGMKIAEQQRIVAAFRAGEVNLVLATKVAEEGLDFRACNVVIRFDGLQTMTGYIQSRGRAREKHSDFIVLAEPGSLEEQVYLRCQGLEPHLRAMYGSRLDLPEIDEEDGPDLPNTPTYRVPETGALLTYGTAIPLLSEYCSLLRFDAFSPSQRPQYTIEKLEGDPVRWECHLVIPMIHSLGGLRNFESGPWPSKRVAKQSVAFEACLALRKVGAIDQWLLPVRERLGNGGKDAYGRTLETMGEPKSELWVSYQNILGAPGQVENAKEYFHVVELRQEGGELYRVGFVTDRSLETVLAASEHLFSPEGAKITMRLCSVEPVPWSSPEERRERMQLLQEVNRNMSRCIINRRIPLDAPFEILWTPLCRDFMTIDWDMLKTAFTPVDTNAVLPGSILVVLSSSACHVARLDEVRKDVSTLSDTMSIDGAAQKKRLRLVERYPQFFIYIKVAYHWSGLEETTDEAVLTVTSVPVPTPNYLCLPSLLDLDQVEVTPRTTTRNYPISMCRTCNLDERFWQFIPMIPSLNRLIEDMTRVAVTIEQFKLPTIDRTLLRQALTPPSVATGLNYEILETVGDSFLKLATTLHIYFQFPSADEGRLTVVRQNSVSNTFLRARNLATGYSNAILARTFLTAHWVPGMNDVVRPSPADGEESTNPKGDPSSTAFAALQRKVGRKALADVIESTLGAAIVTGGIPMALETGERLGLCFGGTTPWHEREGALKIGSMRATDIPVGLVDLERRLAYKFQHHGEFLLQAITHRSCRAATTYCYEREEFLGDALLDFWATDRIFKAFPQSTPRHLTFMRALLVSNPTLAFLAIRVLDLHKTILHGSPTLEQAMLDAQMQAGSMTWEMVLNGEMTWLWSPPKVLGDAFEATLGAIFLDAGCRMEPVFETLDHIYREVMPLMRNVETRDPYSRLLIHAHSNGCQRTKVKVARVPYETRQYEATASIHDHVLTTNVNLSQHVARQLAAREALEALQQEVEDHNGALPTKSFVDAPCTCRSEAEAARAEAERLRKEREEAEDYVLPGEEEVEGVAASEVIEDEVVMKERGDGDEEEEDDEEDDQSNEKGKEGRPLEDDQELRPYSPKRVRSY